MFKDNRAHLGTDLLLMLTAAIWGFAFVAQRAGMEFIGPFLFNAVRFALGTAVLLPLIFLSRGKKRAQRVPLKYGILAGLILFAGASLQQVGLVYTTAGNAGFVTGLYVVMVPVLGLFWGQSSGKGTWAGAALAVSGMFLLTNAGSSRMLSGDIIVFTGAIFWALHIQLISRLMKRYDALSLAALQFGCCSLLSALSAILTEKLSLSGIRMAAVPILYGGLVSVGIAYTLQVVAQKRAHPAHAAIIMSLEAVFALIGGWIMLAEPVTLQGTAGGALMLAAMISSAREQGKARRSAGL
ncbi:EamA family transporter [Candidatus Fermentibacteria bacterium]|nr:MAG: EamA family transporter [Candidatus Fermentibacteria bacterium]